MSESETGGADRRPETGQVLSVIRFRVFPEKQALLPRIWGAQRTMLRGQEGFLWAELLEGGERGGEGGEFQIVTRWASAEHLEAWKSRPRDPARKDGRMARMLRGESEMVSPPYEVSRWTVRVTSDDEEAPEQGRGRPLEA